jgi:hypothetical protein
LVKGLFEIRRIGGSFYEYEVLCVSCLLSLRLSAVLAMEMMQQSVEIAPPLCLIEGMEQEGVPSIFIFQI